MFSDPAYTNLKPNYQGLTWKKYRTGKKRQVETLIHEIHPDYITIANEPSTESRLTLANYKQFEMLSVFWSKYFWGYLPYNQTTRNLSPVKSVKLVNLESFKYSNCRIYNQSKSC